MTSPGTVRVTGIVSPDVEFYDRAYRTRSILSVGLLAVFKYFLSRNFWDMKKLV